MIFPRDEFEYKFLKILKEHIGEDLMFFDGLGNIPTFDFNYANPFVVVSLCTCGWIEGEYDLRPIQMECGDLSVLLPDHLISFSKRSEDYDSINILMSKGFALELRQAGSLKAQTHFNRCLSLRLSEEEQQIFCNVTDTIRFVLRHRSEERVEIVKQLFGILFRIFQDFEAVKEMESPNRTRQEEVFERFHDAIIKYHRQSREALFYADKLCISPKYMSSIIKKVTGKSANEWINDYIIRESKVILKNEKQKTILEISDLMGFPDQATFSKFFKKHVGITPSDYRLK